MCKVGLEEKIKISIFVKWEKVGYVDGIRGMDEIGG